MAKLKDELGNAILSRYRKNNPATKKQAPKQKNSVLHQKPMAEFIEEATVTNRDFTAVKESTPRHLQEKTKSFLVPLGQDTTLTSTIPRKPKWNKEMSQEEFQQKETLDFLAWKKNIRQVAQNTKQRIVFEQNIEIWRQLWHIIEHCDIIAQIVDARNPLLFYNEEVEACVREMGRDCRCVLVMNKTDLIPPETRLQWVEHFKGKNTECFCFSAEQATPDVFTDSQLIDAILGERKDGNTSVGVVGYPNVGKSTLINKIFGTKRVSVGSMPGKTKHIQSLFFSNDVVVLDCPGLVFPRTAVVEAEYLLNGILSLSALSKHLPSITLLGTLLGWAALSEHYKVRFTGKTHQECARAFLAAYATRRGFMRQSKGGPDETRAAQSVLADVVAGSLVLCVPPGGIPRKQIPPAIAKNNSEELLDKTFFSTAASVPDKAGASQKYKAAFLKNKLNK
ncbi:MAG: large subunit GTPase 1 [Amphiamblys sp. WSBS2006]|nr:MAG: large subunit GTPase 1 [Amphiamblys sp. WSBS2006]